MSATGPDLGLAHAATQVDEARRFNRTTDVTNPTVADDDHGLIGAIVRLAAPPRCATESPYKPAITNASRYWHSKAAAYLGSVVVSEDQRLAVLRIGIATYPNLADVAQFPSRTFRTVRRDQTLQAYQFGAVVIGLE